MIENQNTTIQKSRSLTLDASSFISSNNFNNNYIKSSNNKKNNYHNVYEGLSNKSQTKSYLIKRSVMTQQKPSNFFKMTNILNNSRNIQIQDSSNKETQSLLILSGIQIQGLSNQQRIQQMKININLQQPNKKNTNRIKKHMPTYQSLMTLEINSYDDKIQEINQNQNQKVIIEGIPYKKHSYNLNKQRTSRQFQNQSEICYDKIDTSFSKSLPKRNSQIISLPSIINNKYQNLNNSLKQIQQNQQNITTSFEYCKDITKNQLKLNPQIILSNRHKIDKNIHQKDPLYKLKEQTQDYKAIKKLKRYQRLWRGKQLMRSQQQQKFMKNNIKGITNMNFIYQRKSHNTRNNHFYNHYRNFTHGYQKQSLLTKSLQKSQEYIHHHNSQVGKRLYEINFEDSLRGGDKEVQNSMKRDIKGIISPHIQGLKGKGSGKGKNIKLYFEQIFMIEEVFKISKE